jgi:hypothetical protein
VPHLPAHPDLDQLRHRAMDLLRDARGGQPDALRRIRTVSGRTTLAAAQLAVAREHGFPSWTGLAREVGRREALDDRDLDRLRALLSEEPGLATTSMEQWPDHPLGASPLGYVAMLRFDTASGEWRDLPGTADVARVLLAAGAAVDGGPGDRETPLITAASYGDAAVARVLIVAGADVDALAAPNSGGVPGGSALLHAAVFGMTEVVDLLVAAGARVRSIEEAAAAGDIRSWLHAETPAGARLRALVMAAQHERLGVIEQLVAAGTPVDGTDETFGRHPLRQAAADGRASSVRLLLALGADPTLRDRLGRTPLALCREGAASAGRDEVERMLAPLSG